eukprot:7348240-Pyramimonas_sp.AAC.1
MEFQLSHCPRADPTFAADEHPLVYWLRALHGEWVKHRAMASAFMQAQNQLRTLRGVRGPAGAGVMTFKRLNWTTTSWDCWITERGAKLNLHDIGPAALRRIVDQATQRRLLREVQQPRGMEVLAGPPLLEPAKEFISMLRQQEDYNGAGLIRTWLA